MRSTLLTLASLLLGFALLTVSNSLQGTLLSVRAGLEGFSATATGLVVSGFFAGMCLGSFRASNLIGRVGHIRAFAALASVASAATLVHLVFIEPWTWIAVRTATGFCFAGLIIAVEGWLNASIDSERRGQLLSIYAMAGMAAGAVGQSLLTLGNPAGFTLFVLVSIVMSLALVPIALSKAVAPAPDMDQAPPSVLRLWRISPFGAVAPFFTGASIGAFFGLAPLFVQQIGFGQNQIAILMTAATLGGLALQYPVGWLSDRADRRLVCIALTLVAALVCGVISRLEVPSLAISLALALLLGGALLPTHSIVVAHVNDRTAPGALLATSGGIVLVNGIGAALGPVAGGAMMEAFGPVGLLYVIGACQFAIAAFGLVRMFLLEEPSAAQKGDFTPVPITPVEGELDYRRDEPAPAM